MVIWFQKLIRQWTKPVTASPVIGVLSDLTCKLLVIIYTMLKTKQPSNEYMFLERKNTSEQKRVKRMVNELPRLGYAVSLAA